MQVDVEARLEFASYSRSRVLLATMMSTARVLQHYVYLNRHDLGCTWSL